MEGDDLLTDPVESSQDSPPRQEQESPPSPEDLFAWANKTVLVLKERIFSLLGRIGFLKQSYIDSFNIHEKSIDGHEDNDSWIEKLCSSKKSLPSATENAASRYQASTSKDESSGSSASFTSQALIRKHESSGSRVTFTTQASTSTDESSGSSVPFTNQALISEHESSGSRVTFATQASTSTDESSESSVSFKTPALKEMTWIEYGALLSSNSSDLPSLSKRILKEIEEFCTKYLRHKEEIKKLNDEMIKLERAFALKRFKRSASMVGKLDLKKLMPLLSGLRELKFLTEKITKDQNFLDVKLGGIMRRKKCLDKYLRKGQYSSLIAQKNNYFSYSLFWIYKNLFFINKTLDRGKKYLKVYQIVKRKVQQQLDNF